ncbi:hypothetical protein M9Y10_046122, partial [Tritrichomonas musculus]
MSTELATEFVPLIGFEDSYEILNQYPFTIRNKNTSKIISERFDKDGYAIVCLKSYPHKKHRLIALQFIPNPDNLPHVDHLNHNKVDNRLENLRWASIRDNDKNRSCFKGVHYQFVDSIPEDVAAVDFYDTTKERRVFDENRYYYYFDEDTKEDIFYGKIDENIYKIIHKNKNKAGNQFVMLTDKNNKGVSLYINKFKQQHD